MNSIQQIQKAAPTATRKPFEAPLVRREAHMEMVTAGSFDLFVLNAP